MALDAYIELYHGGIIPIQEFAAMPMTKDILVRVVIKKVPLQIKYMEFHHLYPQLNSIPNHINQ